MTRIPGPVIRMRSCQARSGRAGPGHAEVPCRDSRVLRRRQAAARVRTDSESELHCGTRSRGHAVTRSVAPWHAVNGGPGSMRPGRAWSGPAEGTGSNSLESTRMIEPDSEPARGRWHSVQQWETETRRVRSARAAGLNRGVCECVERGCGCANEHVRLHA